jgi:hypothetical protein
MRLKALLFSLFMGLSGLAAALAPAVVDTVQAPAWLDRGGLTHPLTAGVELKSGDVVRTGPGARAYLKMAEGSMVKLGESARFTLYSRSLHPEKLLKGALDIAAGAFRFTTDSLRKVRSQRDLSIRVATATIGVRGTDVWGKAGKDRDLVALIEGQISLSRAGQDLVITPMSIMDAPRGAAAEIKPLNLETLLKLARETEIVTEDGAYRARRTGDWHLDLGVFSSQQEALDRYDQIRAAGYAASVAPKSAEAGWSYAVRLDGFATPVEAEIVAARVQAATGVQARPAR